MEINPLAVLLAALSAFLIGGLWYSVLLARPWQAAAGVSDEQLGKGRVRAFLGSFLLALVIAISLGAFIGNGGAAFGAVAGLLAGATFVAAALGINYLFERRSLRLFVIDAGYNVITFTVMGVLLGALQA
jgi:hypothetical protein